MQNLISILLNVGIYDCPVPIAYGTSLPSSCTVHYFAAIKTKHEDAKLSHPQNILQLQISIHSHARSIYVPSSCSPRNNAEYSSDNCLSK